MLEHYFIKITKGSLTNIDFFPFGSVKISKCCPCSTKPISDVIFQVGDDDDATVNDGWLAGWLAAAQLSVHFCLSSRLQRSSNNLSKIIQIQRKRVKATKKRIITQNRREHRQKERQRESENSEMERERQQRERERQQRERQQRERQQRDNRERETIERERQQRERE